MPATWREASKWILSLEELPFFVSLFIQSFAHRQKLSHRPSQSDPLKPSIMDAAAIEAFNKVRASMGLKPLPVPGAAPQSRESSPEQDEDAPSTLESREALAYDNYKRVQDAELAKRKRDEKAAAIKKARDKAQRFTVLEGKGLGDLDEEDEQDAKAWLKNSKKRQKQIDRAKKLSEEKAAAEKAAADAAQHTSKDLAGVKVAHDIGTFEDGDEQILTLKDTGILDDEDEGDELENLSLREQEQLKERLDLKRKKPLYDPNNFDDTGEQSILGQYDEEIYGKKKKLFTLNDVGASEDIADILSAPVQSRKRQVVDLGELGMFTFSL